MMTAKKNISKVEARLNGIEYEEGSNLSFSQKQYNYWLEKLGEHHPITLRRGELLCSRALLLESRSYGRETANEVGSGTTS